MFGQTENNIIVLCIMLSLITIMHTKIYLNKNIYS